MDERTALAGHLGKARAGGAKAAEVLLIDREHLELGDSRGRPTRREDRRFVVRVWLDGGKAGIGRATDPDVALAEALKEASGAAPDPLAGPVERISIRTGGFGVDDRRHEQIADSDRAEVLHLTEKALSGASFRPKGLLYSQTREERAWASSRGVDAAEAATTYVLSAEVLVENVVTQQRIASRHFSDVASLPFGTELRRRLEPLFRKTPSLPRLPLVLDPRVLAELARAIAPAFAADAVRGGRSFVKDFLGQRLASSIFHLTDDAGLFGALLTRAFDERGVPPIPVALLKEGVVSGLYHDPETARAEGLRPTGHVWNGVLAPSNLIVRPGSRTRNVVLGELGPHLLLDRMPAIDISTGMVDGVVPVVVAEKGERRGSQRVHFRFPLTTLLGAFVEVVSDHERSLEVDTPTAVLSADLLPAE